VKRRYESDEHNRTIVIGPNNPNPARQPAKRATSGSWPHRRYLGVGYVLCFKLPIRRSEPNIAALSLRNKFYRTQMRQLPFACRSLFT
jgi:hypothetical protein